MMWLPLLSVVADLTQNHPEWIFQTLPPLTLVFNFQLIVPIFRGDNLLNSMLSQSEMTTDSRPLSYGTHLLSHMYFSKECLFRYTMFRYIVLGLGMTFPNSFVFVYANNKPIIIRLFRSLIKPDYIRINHAFILRSSSFVSLQHDTCRYTEAGEKSNQSKYCLFTQQSVTWYAYTINFNSVRGRNEWCICKEMDAENCDSLKISS